MSATTQHWFIVCGRLNLARLTLRMCNQPLQGDVDVCFLFTRNTITTDLSILHARQIPAKKYRHELAFGQRNHHVILALTFAR